MAGDLNIDSSIASKFSKDVKQFYFVNNQIPEEEDDYIRYKSDVLFIAGIWQILEKQLQKKTPTYLYKFSHSPEFSLVREFCKIEKRGENAINKILYCWVLKKIDFSIFFFRCWPC